MVEVFVNNRQAVVKALTHPSKNVGIVIFTEGADVNVPSMKAWRMKLSITKDSCKAKLGN